jgi:hypothetical protein
MEKIWGKEKMKKHPIQTVLHLISPEGPLKTPGNHLHQPFKQFRGYSVAEQ